MGGLPRALSSAGNPDEGSWVCSCQRSELRHLSKIKVPHLHRWHHHVERFFAAGAHRRAHRFNLRKHFNQTLVEAEVADALLDLSILNIKCPVASHSSKDLLVRINLADVPQARYQDTALGGGNHLVYALFGSSLRPIENNIHRCFAT